MLELNQLYLMDCMDGMAQFPDKYFELAIVDPPYGIGITESGRLSKYNANENKWDKEIPTKKYFDELSRICANAIVWGGNYFELPPTRGFVIWDKKQPQEVSFASCELAWTSFDRSAKTFYYSPLFDSKDSRIHPTQKPVALYKWLLTNYANPGDKILDTHVGSASSLIACHDMGFEYIGFEIDEDYFKAAQKRLTRHKAQQTIFDLQPVAIPEQSTLFSEGSQP